MRILQVNKFLYPKGGAEIVCLNLGAALRDAGHEVRFFGMRDPRSIEIEDADCHPAPVDYHAERALITKAGEAWRTIYGRAARQDMARLLARFSPDIIHCHNIYHQLTPAILAPARTLGIPVLLTLHDYKLLCPVYTFLRRGEICERCLGRAPWPLLGGRCKDGDLPASAVLLAEALLHRGLRSYERGVTRFSAPSRFLRDKMIAGGWDADRVVYLPNSLPFEEAVLARPWAAPPLAEMPKLIWVGRMSHEKGLVTLLQAMSESGVNLRLQLVGDGPLEPELRNLAHELELGKRVEWLGRRDRDEIPDLILQAEGSILPSEWYENAPLALMEPLALGRAALASDLGGVPEMFTPGRGGWLFPAGDRAALAAALRDWVASREERLVRGEFAYREARERFHPDRIFADTLAIYEDMIG